MRNVEGRPGWRPLFVSESSYPEFVSAVVRGRAHTERMVVNALKLAGVVALVLITAGAWPNPRYGAAISIGMCMMAAIALHFAAP